MQTAAICMIVAMGGAMQITITQLESSSKDTQCKPFKFEKSAQQQYSEQSVCKLPVWSA
jgi:hypothetical protein